jgi:predicted transcriptional regulator
MSVYSFDQIRERAARLGVSQKHLCGVADVNETTFSKAKTHGREPTPRIRRRLSVAIDSIAAERGVKFVEETGAKQ